VVSLDYNNLLEFLKWSLDDLPIIEGKIPHLEIRFKCSDNYQYTIIRKISEKNNIPYFENQIFIKNPLEILPFCNDYNGTLMKDLIVWTSVHPRYISKHVCNRWTGEIKNDFLRGSESSVFVLDKLFFDIEEITKQGLISDENRKKLYNYGNIFIEFMIREYNMVGSYQGDSGCGLMVLFKINNIMMERNDIKITKSNKNNKTTFGEEVVRTKNNQILLGKQTAFYEEVKDKFEKYLINNGHSDLVKIFSFDTNVMKDCGRVCGLPETYNVKYDEKPKRLIFKFGDYVRNKLDLSNYQVSNFIGKTKKNKDEIKSLKIEGFEKIIFEKSEEIRLLTKFDNFPLGHIHNTLGFAIKTLLQRYNISSDNDNYDILQNSIISSTNNDLDINPDRFGVGEYHMLMIINWTLKYKEWCIENNFKCKYLCLSRRPSNEFFCNGYKFTNIKDLVIKLMNCGIFLDEEYYLENCGDRNNPDNVGTLRLLKELKSKKMLYSNDIFRLLTLPEEGNQYNMFTFLQIIKYFQSMEHLRKFYFHSSVIEYFYNKLDDIDKKFLELHGINEDIYKKMIIRYDKYYYNNEMIHDYDYWNRVDKKIEKFKARFCADEQKQKQQKS